MAGNGKKPPQYGHDPGNKQATGAHSATNACGDLHGIAAFRNRDRNTRLRIQLRSEHACVLRHSNSGGGVVVQSEKRPRNGNNLRDHLVVGGLFDRAFLSSQLGSGLGANSLLRLLRIRRHRGLISQETTGGGGIPDRLIGTFSAARAGNY